MKLEEFSVTNFRSITKAYKIKMSNFTVLVGKNNEGKSNFLLALNIALESIKEYSAINLSKTRRYKSFDKMYIWDRDFPIQLQNNTSKAKTIFRCKFVLDDIEIQDFHNETKLNGNNTINVHIEYSKDGSYTINIPKQSTNSYNDNAYDVTEYISKHLYFNYIPTIRTENTVRNNIEVAIYSQLHLLHNDKKYVEAINIINELETESLNNLSNNLKEPLKLFIPKLNDIKIVFNKSNMMNRTRFPLFSIKIDDGQLTEINYKGDGIKSLITLAILNQPRNSSETSIVAIEEPESHLHPGAIHNIVNILNEISKNSQIIISTHSPLFVRRNHIKSNVIVGDGVAKQANDIEEIREILGVCMEDNLQDTRFVLLVEGDDDKKSLNKILSLKSKTIEESLNNNIFSIKSMGGSGNLIYNIIELNNNLCSFFALLDNDSAGKAALEKAEKNISIDSSIIKLTLCDGMKESEFEDCIKEEFYKDLFFKEFKVDIYIGCKNKNKKWSDRMKDIFNSQGTSWNDNIKEKAKMLIANEISESKVSADEILIKQKSGFIDSLVFNLEELIKNAD